MDRRKSTRAPAGTSPAAAARAAPTLPRPLWRRLRRVRPSSDGSLHLRPCRVRLKEGRWIDRVYLVEEEDYLRHWKVPPGKDPARRALPVEAIDDVAESLSRLPARFADRLYRAGESGKGYAVFTLVLSDGRRLPYLTGHAVDFPQWPDDVTPDIVVDALPHAAPPEFRRRTPGPQEAAAPHLWCLYRRPPARWPRLLSAAWTLLAWACAAILADAANGLLGELLPLASRVEGLRWLAAMSGRASRAACAAAAVALQAGLLAAPMFRQRSVRVRMGVLIAMLPGIVAAPWLLELAITRLPAGPRGQAALFITLWLIPVLNAVLLAWQPSRYPQAAGSRPEPEAQRAAAATTAPAGMHQEPRSSEAPGESPAALAHEPPADPQSQSSRARTPRSPAPVGVGSKGTPPDHRA